MTEHQVIVDEETRILLAGWSRAWGGLSYGEVIKQLAAERVAREEAADVPDSVDAAGC